MKVFSELQNCLYARIASHKSQPRLCSPPTWTAPSLLFQHQNRCSKLAFSGRNTIARRNATTLAAAADLKALVFDCDGVIIESEDLHRRAYNAAFAHFDVRCNGEGPTLEWTEEFYDMLQNKVGGGKPKMRWYFGENGWPTSKISPSIPETDDERAALVDILQDWKTTHYQELIGSGEVEARPGVVELMDEARQADLKVAVCSAATKSSVIFVLENLLGRARFQALDVFLAGDDVPNKKPDPLIYRIATERLGVDPAECLVIEDSTIGLQAALGAGMRCLVTYTSSTKGQDFNGAERILESLGALARDGNGVLAGITEPAAQVVDDRR